MNKDEMFEMEDENHPTPKAQGTPKPDTLHGSTANLNWVVNKFQEFQKEDLDQALPVAAVKTLVEVLRASTANTLMGLEIEVKNAISLLLNSTTHDQLALSCACELFGRFVTKKTKTLDNFDEYKTTLILRGEKYAEAAARGREKVASFADNFIRDGAVTTTQFKVLETVLQVFERATKKGKRFSVVATESRPDDAGLITARRLQDLGIPCEIITDSAVAHNIDRVDMVIVGAESICENGGILNKIGTYQTAIVAKAFKKPIYVCAESFKFMRFYPLNQRDMDWKSVLLPPAPDRKPTPASPRSSNPNSPAPHAFSEQLLNSSSSLPRNSPITSISDRQNFTISKQERDYTPPSLITLLFTDLGILTPSAVSDELIKLY